MSKCNYLLNRLFPFSWIKTCQVIQEANTVIAEHLEMMIDDLNDRFYDLKAMEFPPWLI